MVRDHRLTRRQLLRGLGAASLCAVGAQLAGCAKPTPVPPTQPPPTAVSEQPVSPPPTDVPPTPLPQGPGGYAMHTDTAGEITFWHFWGSPVRRGGVRRIIGAFNAIYPEIKVTETFVPWGDIWTKNIAAVAAGSGMPDVLVEDRPQLRARAQNKIDLSLAELANRDGVTGDAFWPFTWTEATVDGEPYGLPYETDIRVLFVNQYALNEVGLATEKPPTNWDALWDAADKLDLVAEDGKLERVGFHPLWGNTGLDQWVWCNGGDWQDAEFNPTINSETAVATLTWIKKWVDRYGKDNWDAFRGTFGQGKEDDFMSGRVAMKVDIAGYTSFINFYDPRSPDGQRLAWAVSPPPAAPGKKPASLSGGFALSIPRGVKNIDPAWEFIKYAVFDGQASWARDTYSMPTIEAMAKEDPVLNADPKWRFFVEAMAYGKPALFNPYYPSMLEVLGPAVDAVILGQKSPQEALDEAQQQAEAEIAKNR